MLGHILKSTLGSPANMLSVNKPDPNAKDATDKRHQDFEESAKHHYENIDLSVAARNLNNTADEVGVDWKGVTTLAGKLNSNLHSVFTQYGIDTSQPIRINVNPFTGVPVIGDHPDKERIIQLLQNKPEIVKQIHTVNSVANYSYQSSQRETPQPTAPVSPQASKVQSALNQYAQNSQTSLVSLQFDKLNGLIVNVNNQSVASIPATTA